MRLAVVVPTRNRPHEIAKLLENLEQQSRPPDSVTVIDSSDNEFLQAVERHVSMSSLSCHYLRHWPPSAAAQRNAGLNAVLDHTDLVALVDDDVTLARDAFEDISKRVDELELNIVGFGLNPIDSHARRQYGPLKSSRLMTMLGLYSNRTAAVTTSGWHTRPLQVSEPTEVDWLTTCAVVWRASAIRNLRFDEFFEEYSYLEDLEFSLQARQCGRFVVLPEPTYLHDPAEGGRKSRFWFGRIEIRNRLYIVRKHGLSESRFWVGAGLRALLTIGSVLCGHLEESTRFFGNCAEAIRVGSRRKISGK